MNIEINCSNCARNHTRPNAKDRCSKEFLARSIKYEREKRPNEFIMDIEKKAICPEWKSGADVCSKIYDYFRKMQIEERKASAEK